MLEIRGLHRSTTEIIELVYILTLWACVMDGTKDDIIWEQSHGSKAETLLLPPVI